MGSQEPAAHGHEGGKTSRLIVKNLPKRVTESDLLEHLRRVVAFPVTDCRIVRKSDSDDSRMFGFIGFKSIEDASAAQLVLNASFLGTRRVYVDFALQAGDSGLSRPWSKVSRQKKEAEVRKKAESKENATVELPEVVSKTQNNDDDNAVCRLRVVNLPFQSTEEEFADFLRAQGVNYQAVSLIREADSEYNKGYGFITFGWPTEADAALVALNGSIFQGRVLRFETARALIREADLTSASSEKVCGSRKRGLNETKRQIEDKKRQRQENQQSWNLLYVSANAAVDTVAQSLQISKEDIYNLEGDDSLAARSALTEVLMVNETRKWLAAENLSETMFQAGGTSILSSSLLADKAERSKDTLFIKHLGPWVDNHELRALFQQFGLISRFSVAPSSLVAIVTFVDPKDAQKAFSSLLLSKYKSYPLYLEWAPQSETTSSTTTTTTTTTTTATAIDIQKDESTKPGSKKILVKNLPFQANPKDLRQLFQICGNILSVRIPKKADGSNRGFAFIQFSTANEAELALLNLTNVHLYGRHLVVMESEE